MVMQKAVDNMKDRPEDERKALAGGIATLVVAILIIGWAILFFRKIQNGGVQVNQLGGDLKSQFDVSPITDAQKQLINSYKSTTDELKAIRYEAAQQQVQSGKAGY